MTRLLNIILLGATVASVTNAQGRIFYFSLPSTENEVKYLDERLTVIDFWATWCQPCIRSLPSLVELSEEFGRRDA